MGCSQVLFECPLSVQPLQATCSLVSLFSCWQSFSFIQSEHFLFQATPASSYSPKMHHCEVSPQTLSRTRGCCSQLDTKLPPCCGQHFPSFPTIYPSFLPCSLSKQPLPRTPAAPWQHPPPQDDLICSITTPKGSQEGLWPSGHTAKDAIACVHWHLDVLPK